LLAAAYANASAEAFQFLARTSVSSIISWNDRQTKTLNHCLFKVTVAGFVTAVPPHHPKDNLTLKMTLFEIVHQKYLNENYQHAFDHQPALCSRAISYDVEYSKPRQGQPESTRLSIRMVVRFT